MIRKVSSLDSRGVSFIDVAVALVLFSAAIVLMFNFLSLEESMLAGNQEKILIHEKAQMEVAVLYSMSDWLGIGDYLKSAGTEKVSISLVDHVVTPYNTERISIDFSTKNESWILNLERVISSE